MSQTVSYTELCGCEFEIEVEHDWVDESSSVLDVNRTKYCHLHIPIHEIVKTPFRIWTDDTRGRFKIVVTKEADL